MTDRLARGKVDPDLRIFLPGRIRNELEGVTLPNPLYARLPAGKHDPVHGRTESSGPALGERRDRAGR
jgi:hypothetical protein